MPAPQSQTQLYAYSQIRNPQIILTPEQQKIAQQLGIVSFEPGRKSQMELRGMVSSSPMSVMIQKQLAQQKVQDYFRIRQEQERQRFQQKLKEKVLYDYNDSVKFIKDKELIEYFRSKGYGYLREEKGKKGETIIRMHRPKVVYGSGIYAVKTPSGREIYTSDPMADKEIHDVVSSGKGELIRTKTGYEVMLRADVSAKAEVKTDIDSTTEISFGEEPTKAPSVIGLPTPATKQEIEQAKKLKLGMDLQNIWTKVTTPITTAITWIAEPIVMEGKKFIEETYKGLHWIHLMPETSVRRTEKSEEQKREIQDQLRKVGEKIGEIIKSPIKTTPWEAKLTSTEQPKVTVTPPITPEPSMISPAKPKAPTEHLVPLPTAEKMTTQLVTPPYSMMPVGQAHLTELQDKVFPVTFKLEYTAKNIGAQVGEELSPKYEQKAKDTLNQIVAEKTAKYQELANLNPDKIKFLENKLREEVLQEYNKNYAGKINEEFKKDFEQEFTRRLTPEVETTKSEIKSIQHELQKKYDERIKQEIAELRIINTVVYTTPLVATAATMLAPSAAAISLKGGTGLTILKNIGPAAKVAYLGSIALRTPTIVKEFKISPTAGFRELGVTAFEYGAPLSAGYFAGKASIEDWLSQAKPAGPAIITREALSQKARLPEPPRPPPEIAVMPKFELPFEKGGYEKAIFMTTAEPPPMKYEKGVLTLPKEELQAQTGAVFGYQPWELPTPKLLKFFGVKGFEKDSFLVMQRFYIPTLEKYSVPAMEPVEKPINKIVETIIQSSEQELNFKDLKYLTKLSDKTLTENLRTLQNEGILTKTTTGYRIKDLSRYPLVEYKPVYKNVEIVRGQDYWKIRTPDVEFTIPAEDIPILKKLGILKATKFKVREYESLMKASSPAYVGTSGIPYEKWKVIPPEKIPPATTRVLSLEKGKYQIGFKMGEFRPSGPEPTSPFAITYRLGHIETPLGVQTLYKQTGVRFAATPSEIEAFATGKVASLPATPYQYLIISKSGITPFKSTGLVGVRTGPTTSAFYTPQEYLDLKGIYGIRRFLPHEFISTERYRPASFSTATASGKVAGLYPAPKNLIAQANIGWSAPKQSIEYASQPNLAKLTKPALTQPSKFFGVEKTRIEIQPSLELADIIQSVTKPTSQMKPYTIPLIETKITQVPDLSVQLKPRISTKIVPETTVKLASTLTPALAPVLAPASAPALRPAMIPKVQPKVQLEIKPIIEQRMGFTITPTITPKLSIQILPPIIQLSPIKKKAVEKREYRMVEGWLPLIKRQGEYKPIITKPAPKHIAIRLGEQKVLETLAASFKVIPTKQKIAGEEQKYVPSPLLFRSYKIVRGRKIPLEHEWIQRKETRLGRKSEVREVHVERRKWLAGGKPKRKWKWI